MYDIHIKIDDYPRPICINLNALGAVDPYHINYPITYVGYVNSEKVEIVQKSVTSFCVDDYDWVMFPEKFNQYKSDIVKGIDDYLKGSTR